MKHLQILIILLFFALNIGAQPPGNFVVTIGGPGVDIGYAVKETYNKGYIVVGSTTSYGAGFSDVYLVLVDSMGGPVWSKTYGGMLSDVGKGVAISPADSGFILTGYTNSFGGGGYDIYVLRVNKHGEIIWQTTYGGSDWDFGNDVIFSADGNIVICGNVYGSYGKKDAQALKLNYNSGSIIWAKQFGGAEDDEFMTIKETSDGFYTFCGNTRSMGDINNDFWMFKLNAQGDSVTSKSFGNPNKADYCYDFLETQSHGLIFCGSFDTSVTNAGKSIAYTIRTDLSGKVIKQTTYSHPDMKDDKLYAVAEAKYEHQFCFSRKADHPGFQKDIQPYLVSDSLDFVNTTTYGGTKDEEAFDIINTWDKGFVMVGYSLSYNQSVEDIYLVKVDSALVNSQVMVSVNDRESNGIEKFNEVYCYDNIIYFRCKIKPIAFAIYNLDGKIVQSGLIKDDFVKFREELSDGIYFIALDGGIKKKILKQEQ